MSCENGIPYGTGPSEEAIGAVAAKVDYTPKNIDSPRSADDGRTPEERAEEVIDFFLSKGFTIEFALGVAGVWGQESQIQPWSYNRNEHETGGYARGKHAPDCGFFFYPPNSGKKEYRSEENMKLFGYGKGLAQWSWDRVLAFRDWYNGATATKTSGLSGMDEYGASITATSMNTQLDFAWKEMEQRRGEFMQTVRGMQHVSHLSNPEKFKENVKVAVDAVTRGFENGSSKSMATVEQMNNYSGDYWGIDFKNRYEWALGLYEKIKSLPKYSEYLN